MLATTSRQDRDCSDFSRIRVVDCDSLIFVGVVANNTFSEYVKGSTHENVVGWVANDVNL